MDGILEQILKELKEINERLKALSGISDTPSMPNKEVTSDSRAVTLTGKEAAEYLGISYGHILEMAKRKEIPCIRAGARVLFRQTILDNWIKSQENESIKKESEPEPERKGTLRKIKI